MGFEFLTEANLAKFPFNFVAPCVSSGCPTYYLQLPVLAVLLEILDSLSINSVNIVDFSGRITYIIF